jgi:hypothetical protein
MAKAVLSWAGWSSKHPCANVQGFYALSIGNWNWKRKKAYADFETLA